MHKVQGLGVSVAQNGSKGRTKCKAQNAKVKGANTATTCIFFFICVLLQLPHTACQTYRTEPRESFEALPSLCCRCNRPVGGLADRDRRQQLPQHTIHMISLGIGTQQHLPTNGRHMPQVPSLSDTRDASFSCLPLLPNFFLCACSTPAVKDYA